LWFGGRDVVGGRLTLGEFVAFSRYLVLLSWPLIAFGWVINLVQRGIASWERMLEVLDAPLEAQREVVPHPAIAGGIEARHLSFEYPGATAPAVDDVSFRIEPGQTLALVGATGSGKSTMVQLLARLREPARGTLFVDGIDVRDLDPAELRAAMAIVPQEPFLFSESVGGNIVFGLGEEWSDDPDIRRAAREAATLAALDRDVSDFANGYDTIVGERGITLSGGQKQRAALARALATKPRVLVLDDALSAVDTATEEKVLRGLAEVRKGRTCLIVAHRISTVRDADLILVLDQGRVVERGTHDELVGLRGAYAAMHERQLLEEEVSSA
jgi:ATP-binding cassette subfamily B protein